MVGSLKQARVVLTAGRVGLVINAALALVVLVLAGVLVTRIAAGGLSYFIQILSFGIGNGSIYALIALGYTMVYGIVELINFAHGDVFAMGGFVALFLLPLFGVDESKGGTAAVVLPLIAVFLITMAFCGLVNITIERVAYRPLRRAPRLAPLITAVGMSFVIEGILFLWKGPFNTHFPNLLPTTGIPLVAGASIGSKDVIVIVVSWVLVGALSVYIERSKLGKAMRATAQNPDAAELMGIDINRTIAATFFIGAVLAGAGGTMYGLYYNNIVFDTGFSAGLFAFTAAVFGGIGNIRGAAVGGLLIGIVSTLWDGYFDSAWTQVVMFGILILVLVFRPTGLFGMMVPEK